MNFMMGISKHGNKDSHVKNNEKRITARKSCMAAVAAMFKCKCKMQ